MSGTRRGIGLFPVQLAKQLDFLMQRAREELNVTTKWLKLGGPGKRFAYAVSCEDCGYTFTPEYARLAIIVVLEHADRYGHSVDVKAPERERNEYETRNANYADKRRPVGKSKTADPVWAGDVVRLKRQGLPVMEIARALELTPNDLAKLYEIHAR